MKIFFGGWQEKDSYCKYSLLYPRKTYGKVGETIEQATVAIFDGVSLNPIKNCFRSASLWFKFIHT
jgi:hypothetical protein